MSDKQIVVKAKRIDNGKWVKGNIIEDGVTGLGSVLYINLAIQSMKST